MSRSLTTSTLLLVAANLVPLAGVIFFQWAVYDVLFLFWLENLIIGLFAVARFAALHSHRKDRRLLLMIPLFCLHYGIFTLVHLVFLIGLFRPDAPAGTNTAHELWLPVVALLISHAASYLLNFLGSGEYRRVSAKELMVAPYRRVVALHITILLGGFVVLALGEPAYALALLVLVKIAIDIVAHRKDHGDATSSGDETADRNDQPVFRGWD